MSEIILYLTAGAGPRECEWVVARLVGSLITEATQSGLECTCVEPVDGPVPSALLKLAGGQAEAFGNMVCGTIKWFGTSPFRPNHKRKNWFVGVQRAPGAADVPMLKDGDINYQAFRASGPGGQHVNTTDSAVRAIHSPTGLTATSQDQRSQFANKKIARLKLALLFEQMRSAHDQDNRQARWTQNSALERGNAVRTYVGSAFRRSA